MSYRAIVPPYILHAMRRHDDAAVRSAAAGTLEATSSLASHPRTPPPPVGERAAGLHRLVYDCAGNKHLPGNLRRREGDAPAHDADVDKLYDACGTAYKFFYDRFDRNSLDGSGMHLISSVHYGQGFDNASWDGAQVVCGDGDGVVFRSFATCLDVVAHELTHGVISAEAGLEYAGESGALNESIADVFGLLVKQWALGQTVDEADWIVGHGQFTPDIHGFGLRSLAAPGSAYDDPIIGKDPQISHMRDCVDPQTPDAVHLNSGIPSHAFYLVAKALGGRAWETAADVWYRALCSGLHRRCTFAEFAKATLWSAQQGANARAATDAVRHAWQVTGISRHQLAGKI